MPKTRRFSFRVSEETAKLIDEIAKALGSDGRPNHSEAIRFFIDFFLIMSNVDIERAKTVSASIFDDIIKKRNKRRSIIK